VICCLQETLAVLSFLALPVHPVLVGEDHVVELSFDVGFDQDYGVLLPVVRDRCYVADFSVLGLG